MVAQSESKEEKSLQKSQNGTTALVPKDLTEAMALAKLMASSNIIPRDFQGKPENVLIAIGMGAEVGLSPMQAIQNIMVVNGRPTMWGDAVLALVQGSGLMEDFREQFDAKTQTAICYSKRAEYSEGKTTTFSLDDARRAGLDKKPGPWQGYTARMLQMRARAWNLRDNFADVLKGIGFREEVEDYDLKEAKEVELVPMPKALETPVGPITAPENIDMSWAEPTLAQEQPKTAPAQPAAPPMASTEAPKAEAPNAAEDSEGYITVDEMEILKEAAQKKMSAKYFLSYLKQYGVARLSEIKVADYKKILVWVEGHK